jgi:hypothetical protein
MIRFPGNLSFFSLLLLAACWLALLLQSSCGENHPESTKKKTPNSELSKTGYIHPNSCRTCHQAIVDSFLLTGKGRSMQSTTHAEDFAIWKDQLPVYDRHRDLYYLPKKKGGDFFIHEFRLENADTIHLRTEKVSQLVGSGNQTVSFFREENGYLYEMPLTWYRKKAMWDLSPGYENGGNYGFEREIGTECLDCHASGFEPIPHSLNRYANSGVALSCNACHGDTEGHLLAMKSGKGKSLEKILRISSLEPQIQMDVCRQCHLEGIKVRKNFDPKGQFSPGKRFSDYYEVFIQGSGGQSFGFASHAERLQMSRCFTQSAGGLTCTSCHDPHNRLPADSKSFFNGKCQSCHSENSHVSLCKQSDPKKSDCISCHLRKSGTSDIPHVNSTDHWIRKRPDVPSKRKGNTELQHFSGRNFSRRELGLAQLQLAENSGDSLQIEKVRMFLNEFDPAEKLRLQYLVGKPGLPDADTMAFAETRHPMLLFQWSDVKKRSGLSWYSDLERACQLAPDRLEFLYRKALADEETGRKPDYESILKRKTLHPEANLNRGFQELQSGNYPKAEFYFKNALKGNPDKVLAIENLARCYLESGKFTEAKKELSRLIRLFPYERRYQDALNSIP